MFPRLLFCLLVFSAARASADVFLVTHTADSGAGSLRQAISDANAHPNPGEVDQIRFSIPGAGVRTITVLSGLPEITEGVLIDGWSQPGFQGSPLIELSGSPGLTADGLQVRADATVIRGLVINGFRNGINVGPQSGNIIEGCYIGTDKTGTLAAPNDTGIVLNQPAHTVIGGARNIISGNRSAAISVTQIDPNSSQPPTLTVKGNYIGTDVTGTVALPNSHGAYPAPAVSLSCRYALIGGTGAGDGNVISGNGAGLFVAGIGSRVQGNLIGTTASGTAALPNGSYGIALGAGMPTVGGTTPAARNVVSGNDGGILIASDSCTVQGNFIGTDISGKIGIGNGNGAGILIPGRQFNVIGGSAAGAGNVISGNQTGILFTHRNDFPPGSLIIDATSRYNIIQGNLIGTDVTGTAAIPNIVGIYFSIGGGRFGFEDATGNEIGGARLSARNVISGNSSSGIGVTGANSLLLIQGNLIGTAVDGIMPLGNNGSGIELGNASQVTIGAPPGANVEAANTIAFNGLKGVTTFGNRENRISANSIHDNAALGLDLGGDGVTANTANIPWNFPVITDAFRFNDKLTVYGTLNSVASKNVTLEFFASSAADSSGFGEGQIFLGQANVTTDSSGNATFNVTFPAPPNVTVVTATSIFPIEQSQSRPSGFYTSEFSAARNIIFSEPTTPPKSPTAVVLPTRAAQLLNISTRVHVGTGDRVLIGGFIISGTEAKKVIIRGLGPSLAAFEVSGFLANPVLELYDSSGQSMASNDDWKQNQRTEIENTGVAPAHDQEAAIVRTLSPGHYTAIVRGHGGTTGNGLVEVYDLAQDTDSHAINVSTRAFAGDFDNVMIGGFIVGGSGGGATSVVIRAMGPSLAAFGVLNPLADPHLAVRTANGTLIGRNDDWAVGADQSRGPDFANAYQRSRVLATGLAPSHELESAVVLELGPGNYTAVVQGKNGSTGVGLVEVYNLR